MITQEQIRERLIQMTKDFDLTGGSIEYHLKRRIAAIELTLEEMQQGKGGKTFEEHMQLRHPGIDPAGFIYEVAQAAWNAAKSSK